MNVKNGNSFQFIYKVTKFNLNFSDIFSFIIMSICRLEKCLFVWTKNKYLILKIALVILLKNRSDDNVKIVAFNPYSVVVMF